MHGAKDNKGPPGNKDINYLPVSSVDSAKNWDVYSLTDPNEEHTMRKIIVSEFVTLDGVMENPSWTFQFQSDEQAASHTRTAAGIPSVSRTPAE